MVLAVLDLLLSAYKLTKFCLLLIFLYPIKTLATPVVPQFRSGSSTTSSTSESVINETITSHQYRTGYTFSVSGHNIESTDIDGYIDPTQTTVNEQTVGGVNFSWTSIDGTTNPRWKVAVPGSSFSLVESVMAPGLDTITTINRTITTSTTTESTSTFGQ